MDEKGWPFLSRWPRLAREMAKSKRGWEAAGLGGWAGGLGHIPLDIGEMGAVLVEEAGCEGLQRGMGQQDRPSVDEG